MSPAAPPADRHRVAGQALALVAALTIVNLLFNLYAQARGFGFPFSTFLFDPADNFGDFFSLLASYPHGAAAIVHDRLGLHALLPADAPSSHLLHLGTLAPVTNLHMTPFSTVLALAALRLARAIDPVALFLLLNAALAGYLAVLVHRRAASRREALAWTALGLLCYPMLMMAARGNLHAGLTSVLLVDALTLGLARRAPTRAALLLAVACNIRPNAIVLALPLLAFYGARRWRFALVLGTAGLALAGSCLALAHALYPAYTVASVRAGLAAYYQLYAVHYLGLAYGSSLFGALKLFAGGWRPGLDGGAMAVAAAIGLAGTALHAARRIGDAALLFLVAAAYALGSTVFGDYHLAVFLVVPMALAAAGAPVRHDDARTRRRIFVAACLVLAPKNYLFLEGDASLQVLLNPAILLVASGLVIAGAVATRRIVPVPAWAASAA